MKPLHNPFFVKFIVYFNENQDFFECHEVLEEYWKSIPDRTKDHPLTAYILLSTGNVSLAKRKYNWCLTDNSKSNIAKLMTQCQ